MSNDSTAYYAAMREADEALQDTLAAIRAEGATPAVSPLLRLPAERVGLLERHLAEVQRLRRELLGEA